MKELIALLNEIKPQYGAVGSRDVDVTAQRKRIDDAIAMLEVMWQLNQIETQTAPAQAIGGFGIDEMKELHKQLVECHTCKAISSAEMDISERNDDLVWARSVIIHAARFVNAHIEHSITPNKNEIMAEGVILFLKYISLYNSNAKHHAESFAEKLRQRDSSQYSSVHKTSIDMEDANHFSYSRLDEIISGKPLVWPEAKLLARFMHDAKLRFSAQEQSND